MPVAVTVNLLKRAMSKSGASKFLVDGFPRNFDNLEGWFAVMGQGPAAHAHVDGVLQFDVSEEVLVARLLKRGETSGRSDDNAEAIVKRLRTYNSSTVPVVEHFEKLGQVTRVFGGDPVDVVFERVRAAVEPVVKAEVAAHNQLLLDAIGQLDWPAYDALVEDGVTCFEPEAKGLVAGKELHKSVFASAGAARAAEGRGASATRMEGARVTLLGPRNALVAYTRVPAPADAAKPSASESRVWRLGDDGRWRRVHFHRSL